VLEGVLGGADHIPMNSVATLAIAISFCICVATVSFRGCRLVSGLEVLGELISTCPGFLA
jgi:hypothetical protein